MWPVPLPYLLWQHKTVMFSYLISAQSLFALPQEITSQEKNKQKWFHAAAVVFLHSIVCLSRSKQSRNNYWEQWGSDYEEFHTKPTLCPSDSLEKLWVIHPVQEERNKYIRYSQWCTPPRSHPLSPHMCEIKAITTLHLSENAISLDKTFLLQKYQWGHIFLLWWPASCMGNSHKMHLHEL